MQVRMMAAVAAIGVFSTSMALAENDSAFQTRYASNITAATDTVVNMSNTGASWGTTYSIPVNNAPNIPQNPGSFGVPGGTLIGNGNICVNVYVTSPDEQLQWCCQCTLTPNALGSATAFTDFISNTLTAQPIPGPSIIVKLVATAETGSIVAPFTTCDATTAGQVGDARFGTVNGLPLAVGLVAWARGNGAETSFSNGSLSQSELFRLTSFCAQNKNNGSGRGYCGTVNFPGLNFTGKCTQIGR